MAKLVGAIVLFLAIIGGLAVIARLLGKPKAGGQGVPPPYRVVDGVLSPGERAFFAALRQACGLLAAELNAGGRAEPLLFVKVRLADVLEVDGSRLEGENRNSARQSAQNRINSKHVDFLVCNPDTTRPVLAIELDDRSHERADRRERDAFVDAAYGDGLPVLHVRAAAKYDPRGLAATMREKLRVPLA